MMKNLTIFTALLLLNLLPLIGVFTWDWQVAPLLFFFWMENVAIGIITLIKLPLARGNVIPAESNMLPPRVASGQARADQAVGFFLLYYGFFTLCHGLLLRQFFPLNNVSRIDLGYVFIVTLTLHFILFYFRYIAGGEYRRISRAQVFLQPFKRMIMLQIAVVIGGFGMDRLGSPLWGLLALVAAKTGYDLKEHFWDRNARFE